MDFKDAAALVETSDDYRILRRVPKPTDWALAPSDAEVRRAVLVDTETTGLDVVRDEVIELALLPFEYERSTGRIVSVLESAFLSAFRQPSLPIPSESTRLHGITDADVAGHAITDDQIRRIIQPAHLVIAHNAAFDRPMVEKHWPIFETKHWACSLADIDWRAEGMGSSKLDYLLFKQGWFFDGHRALSDAIASAFLLTLPLPASRTPALTRLLECARRPLWAVRAEETAFEQRSALKQRGYRWDAGDAKRPKAWWMLTDEPRGEIAWLNQEIYAEPREIPVVSVPATRRYSSRFWL